MEIMKNTKILNNKIQVTNTSLNLMNEYKNKLSRLMFEKDKGGETKNPHILVKRLLKIETNNSPLTLTQLNDILKISINFTITQEEFNGLLSLKLIELEYPLNDFRDTFIGRRLNTSHKERDKNRKTGVYIFTHKKNGYQYVGSSINLRARIRSYNSPSKLAIKRSITNAIVKEGQSIFTLSIYIIDKTLPAFSNSNFLHLSLALEQYLIIKLKSKYNDNKVVGTRPTTLGILRGNNIKQPFYIYNKDCTELLFVAESQKDFLKYSGVSKQTVTNCLNIGRIKPLFNNFTLLRIKLEDSLENLVSQKTLVNIISNARPMRYDKHKQSTHILSQIERVKLIDLTGEHPRIEFVSKNELRRYTNNNFPDRKVGAWKLKGLGPFTINNWLIEVKDK